MTYQFDIVAATERIDALLETLEHHIMLEPTLIDRLMLAQRATSRASRIAQLIFDEDRDELAAIG